MDCFPTSDWPDFDCILSTGIGTSSIQVRMGDLKGTACVNACINLKKADSTVNGVTMPTDQIKQPGCWCEKKMTGIDASLKTMKTCYLQQKSDSELFILHESL